MQSTSRGTAEYYSDRAQDANREATEATLENVRERCLRSAAVWRGLADRATRVDAERRARDADKAVLAVK